MIIRGGRMWKGEVAPLLEYVKATSAKPPVMTIPDYQSIMLPLLKFAQDRREHSMREAYDHITEVFQLSEDERRSLLPSGRQPLIENRVGWSRTYMSKAGLLQSTRRGYFQVTDTGLQVLSHNLPKIDLTFLLQFPAFVEFKSINKLWQ